MTVAFATKLILISGITILLARISRGRLGTGPSNPPGGRWGGEKDDKVKADAMNETQPERRYPSLIGVTDETQ